MSTSWELARLLYRVDFWGWILFLICAIIFVAVGVRDGDALLTVGSLLFLAGCVLFLKPYMDR